MTTQTDLHAHEPTEVGFRHEGPQSVKALLHKNCTYLTINKSHADFYRTPKIVWEMCKQHQAGTVQRTVSRDCTSKFPTQL